MKKEYMRPQVSKHAVGNSTILSGSVKVDEGNTDEQNAKVIGFDSAEDEEEW